MQPQLTVTSWNPESSRKTLLILTILSVLAGWLALAPSYANWTAFVDFFRGKPAVTQQVETRPTNQPPDGGTVPVVMPLPPKVKTELIRKSAETRYVGGVWRSGSGKIFFFNQTTSSSFEIYQEIADNEQVRIGTGNVTSQGINATVRTVKEKRLAVVNLTFSEDGKTLTGTFSGLAQQEKNLPLTLSKEE